MIQWILDHLGVVIFVVIFASQIARALFQAKKTRTEHERRRDPSEEQRRTRELQEQIRRQIAARRGQHSPRDQPPPSQPIPPPIARPQTTQMPELFGGPLGRMLEELQKKVQPPPAPAVPPPAVVTHRHAAELERQQQLAEELRVAEETRHLAQRRAAHAAEDRERIAGSESSLRQATRDRLLGELRDPNSLRRAFLLREVLGPPVGLR